MDRADAETIGLPHVLLGVAAAAVFALRNSDSAVGLLASGALVLVGLAAIARRRLGVDPAAIGDRWRGAFWVAVGTGVAALAVVGAPTAGYLGGGVVIGGGVALYGLLVGW